GNRQPDALVPARRGLLADVGLTNPDAASLILAHRPVRHAPAPPHQACGAGGRTQNPGQAASPQQRTRSVDPHARPQPHAAPNKLSCGAACPSSPAPPTRTPPHRAFATPHPKRQRTRTTIQPTREPLANQASAVSGPCIMAASSLQA